MANRQGQTQRSSLENSFTKVYRFLLNASSVDELALKETLLVADGRNEVSLDVFTRKDEIKKLEKFRKDISYLNKLKSIRKDFEELKLLANQTELNKRLYKKTLACFYKSLSNQIANLEQEMKESEQKIAESKQQEDSLKSSKEALNREISRLDQKLKDLRFERIPSLEKKLESIHQILRETSPLHTTKETLQEFLSSKLEEYEKERRKIDSALHSITTYEFTETEIQKKIKIREQEKEEFQNKFKNYENLLIYEIAESQQIREKLNAILSERVLSLLSKENVDRKVLSLNDRLVVNEGEIQGLDKIPPKLLETKEELQEKLGYIEKDLQQ